MCPPWYFGSPGSNIRAPRATPTCFIFKILLQNNNKKVFSPPPPLSSAPGPFFIDFRVTREYICGCSDWAIIIVIICRNLLAILEIATGIIIIYLSKFSKLSQGIHTVFVAEGQGDEMRRGGSGSSPQGQARPRFDPYSRDRFQQASTPSGNGAGYDSYEMGGHGGGHGGGQGGGHSGGARGYGDHSAGQSGDNFEQGCVLMVYRLHKDKMNATKLFNLFCLYGNVVRVCICTCINNHNLGYCIIRKDTLAILFCSCFCKDVAIGVSVVARFRFWHIS